MKLQYLGHACVRIISEIGTTVVCDPFDKNLVGYPMERVSCDLVTISHGHADHNCIDALANLPTVMDCAGDVVFDDVCVTAFNTYHDDKQGTLRGNNLVFCFLVDGIRVAHLGDIGEVNQDVVNKLAGTQVLILPVGGTYTINHNQAKWYVDQIKPSIVVPIHYAQGGTIDIASVNKFTNLFDNVKRLDDFTLQIDEISSENTQIVVLQRFVD